MRLKPANCCSLLKDRHEYSRMASPAKENVNLVNAEDEQGGYDTQHNDIQHNDNQHNDIQHNDIYHNDIQHNGIQPNGTQHNDTQPNYTLHNI
jgi:hypothetical protein